MENINIINEYKKSDKICPICNKEVCMKDVVTFGSIMTKTKKKKYIFAHRNCVFKVGDK